MLALCRQRLVDLCEMEAGLVYMTSSRSVRATRLSQGEKVLHRNRAPQIVEALSSHLGTSPGEPGSCLGHAFFPWVPSPEHRDENGKVCLTLLLRCHSLSSLLLL